MTRYSCTYDPSDDKLRLTASTRLDKETYEEVKAAGFRWAPKQELFYAMWSPRAEDMAIKLAGEIGDEDTSLVDRAEDRADRFEGYSDKRGAEAKRARDAVSAIADNIPFGQPILVGHHSERAARKDAERIENGMRKAIRLWDTKEYWDSRAAGALAHAKYLEKPEVRARRIKTIEADLRKRQREQAEAEKWLKLWTADGLTLEKARALANYCHLAVEERAEGSGYWSAYDVLRPEGERYNKDCPAYTVEMVQEKARKAYPRSIAWAQRWIDHHQHRIGYETAMLNEQGAGQLLDKKPRPTQLPLVNYRGENGQIVAENRYHRGQLDALRQVDMTSAEYAKVWHEYKGTSTIDGSHRVRVAIVKHERVAVFLTDSKTHDKPAPAPKKEPVLPPVPMPREIKPKQIDPEREEFTALKTQLKAGVEIVTAPELFPTPANLAQRVAELADIQPGMTVLEPSAGTGNLITAAAECGGIVTGIEINQKLASLLRQKHPTIHTADFLQCGPELGKFDRVIMNPPFADQADIAHVNHAMQFLKPGGKLVAIMAAGVSFRQDRKATGFRETLEGMSGTIEPLPDDSFKEAGTSVRTVLICVSIPPERPAVKPTIYTAQTSIFD